MEILVAFRNILSSYDYGLEEKEIMSVLLITRQAAAQWFIYMYSFNLFMKLKKQ